MTENDIDLPITTLILLRLMKKERVPDENDAEKEKEKRGRNPLHRGIKHDIDKMIEIFRSCEGQLLWVDILAETV